MPKKNKSNQKIKNNSSTKTHETVLGKIKRFFSFSNKDFIYFVLVILLATIAGWWLLTPGYYNMHDDLQVMRQLAMETCFRDGQIPCRWTQYMGYGFGFPLFNFYPPLPYIFGELFRLVGFSFVDTAKLTFFSSFIFSGITMYILAREFWGRLGGLLSAAFYIWAPYHALDIYVRGAMNEAWAFIWFPIILWSSYKLILEKKFKYISILAIAFFGLLTSHNLMVIIFSPLFAFWCLLWIVRAKSISVIPKLMISGMLSFGLASFFTIPVILEQKFVHVETLVVGYYEYIAHFATLRQLLISRFWGYGASVWGEEDRMSFQVGHIHWGLSIIVFLYLIWRYFRIKKVDNVTIISFFFIIAGWFAIFMTHNQSTPIWLFLNSVLKFVQFPWRFLSLTILSFSLAIGGLTILFPEKYTKYKYLGVGILILGLIIFNKDFFVPEHGKMGPLTDQQKLTAAAWDLQQTAGIYDYLPNGAYTAPKSPQKTFAEITEGNADLSNLSQISKFGHVTADVKSDKTVLQINIFQFPGWEVFVNGNKTETFVGHDQWGRMHINLDKGKYEVEAKLINTPARTAGNSISLISWLALISIPLWRRKIG